MAAFPFPIPESPAMSERTRVTFAFPPASPYATTAKTRIPTGAVDPEEKEPLFRVPSWIPVPVEGLAYFVVGALIGTFLMLTVITVMTPLRPTAPDAGIPRTVESGVRQATIVGPATATHRAPPAMIEPSPPMRGPIARRR